MSLTETGLNLRPILPSAIQRQFADLGDPRFRPLSDVKTVLRDLGEFELDAVQVGELVECGVLVGFDISVTGSTCCLRVLTTSIQHFRDTGGRKYHDLQWPQIFRQIVRHQKPVVTGLEIRRAILCDRGHVENLIHAGHLTPLKKSQPGPGGSWVVSRTSFETFLKARKI